MKTRKLAAAGILAASLLGVGWGGHQLFASDWEAQASNQTLVQELERKLTTLNSVEVAHEKPQHALEAPQKQEEEHSQAYALLSSERLGKQPVVQGKMGDWSANQALIDTGAIVRYQSTSEIGAEGNTALIGHRITHGSAFKKVPEMSMGEQLTLTTPAGSFDYQVITTAFRVNPDENWILGNPLKQQGVEDISDRKLLTLITCGDWLTTHREVVVLELVEK